MKIFSQVIIYPFFKLEFPIFKILLITFAEEIITYFSTYLKCHELLNQGSSK